MSVEARGLEDVIEALKLFAHILENIIRIEEDQKARFDEMLREILKPETLLQLSEKLPLELRRELMTALLKLATLAPRTQNFLALPTEEKKKILSELESIINSLEKVVSHLRG